MQPNWRFRAIDDGQPRPGARIAQLLLAVPLGLTAAVSSHAAQAPVVADFTASPTVVAPGGVVTLQVEAYDPDCPDVCTTGCGQYVRADLTDWTATGGAFVAEDNGTSGSPYAAAADWQAPPAEGTYTLTVSLSDSGSFFCGGRQTSTASLPILVSTAAGAPPVIDSLASEHARLFPGRTSALTCVASDPDDDPLTYSWSTDSGTVGPGAGGTATFFAADPGVANITCTATDPVGLSASETVTVAVSDAMPAATVLANLAAPQRIAVDPMGDVYVVDGGGLTVVSLLTEDLVYRLRLPGLKAVAVDWNGLLLVGDASGAGVVDQRGALVRSLDPGGPLGDVSDVAVDLARRRYVVLHRSAGRVAIYEAGGAMIGAFGSTGDGADELRRPQGVAVTPAGEIVVADSGHGLVKVYDLAGNLLRAFGGLGGGVGEFVQLDDVAVGDNGVAYASDAYQDWVQTFNPDGSVREVLGTFGPGPGRFMTPTGIAVADSLGRLVVASLNSSSLQVFHLGDAPPALPSPTASLSSESLSFGAQAVGTSSGPQTVLLANSGTGRLGIDGVEVGSDFDEAGDCHLFVPAGGSCTLSVTFLPRAPGARVGSVTVETSAGPAVVALSGDAFVPAALAVSPPGLSFPDQPVGTVSEPEPVTLFNRGTLPLVLSGIRVGADYGLVNGCASTLTGGAGCVVDVHFAPQAPGDAIPGSLIIETDAGGPVTVPLEGRSVIFDLSVAPEALDFGRALVDGTSEPFEVIVTNVGGDFAEVGPVTLEGETPQAFQVQDDLCGLTRLEVGETCRLAVVFRPTEEGSHAATLRIPSNAGDSPERMPLRGEARVSGDSELFFADDFESGDLTAWSTVVPPVVEILAASDLARAELDFGEVPSGKQSAPLAVTLLNASDTSLALGAAELAGGWPRDFRIMNDGCSGERLGRGSACVIQLAFAPTFAELTTAELVVLSRVGEVLGTVTLTGAGASP